MKVTYRVFLDNCKKKPPRIYYTYIYHQLTYPISFILFKLGFSANQISALGIIISIAGGFFIFKGNIILGITLFLLSYLLDCCDGNVARIRYGYLGEEAGSKKTLGLLLENLYPNISYFLFFTSLGYHFFLVTENVLYLLLGIFAYAMKAITRYTVLHISLLNKKVYGGEGQREDKVFKTDIANEVKYFFTRVMDNARLYYISFLLIVVFLPSFFLEFFVFYTVSIFLMNAFKLISTLIRKQP